MKWDWCDHNLLQLKSKRSHTVMCTKACVASVSVRFGSKERGTRVKDRAKNGAFFDSRSISCAVKAENPVPRSFFAPKLNGTLATQAMCTLKGTHVQNAQTDTIRQTDGPLVPMVRLVPIEKHPIPMVLLVHMHLIKET